MTRRRPWQATVISAALAAGMSACGVGAQRPSPIATPLDRVVKIDRASTPIGVISYGTERGNPVYRASVEDAVEVRTTQDLNKLRGAPEDFKAFLTQQLTELGSQVDAFLASQGRTLATEDCDFKVELRVWGIAADVATGRERACGLGSNDVIWAKANGSWQRASRMQGGWDCAELERYRVPADITAAVCWYDEWKTRAYDGPTARETD